VRPWADEAGEAGDAGGSGDPVPLATARAPLSDWQFSAGRFAVLMGAPVPAQYAVAYGTKGVRALSGLDKKLRVVLPIVSAHPASDACPAGRLVRVDYRFSPLRA
jgi:hypothetical protein